MKSISITLFSFLFLILLNCDKVDEKTQFYMDYTTSVTVPSGTGINLPFDMFTPDIETESESEFESNDTRKDLVEEIILEEMTLTITSPSSKSFDFLKSIEIFVEADGVQETKVAWKENIPENIGGVLALEVSNNDLSAYIKKDKFSLRVKAVTDKILGQDVEIKVDAKFFVDAKILGV